MIISFRPISPETYVRVHFVMCSVQNHLYCAISKKMFLPIPAIVQNRKSISPKIRSATPGLRGTNNHCTCINFHLCVCATRFADVEAIWLIGRFMLFCTWRSIKIPPVYIKRNVCIPLPKILWKSKQCKHVKYSNHIQRRAKIINGNHVPQWNKQFDDVILFPLIPTWCSATDFTFWNYLCQGQHRKTRRVKMITNDHVTTISHCKSFEPVDVIWFCWHLNREWNILAKI